MQRRQMKVILTKNRQATWTKIENRPIGSKALQMVEQRNSYRQIAQALHLIKTTVNEIVKRDR